jgi:VIT1/CCC1 family predicted Fe2+/Mn2+ transporter
LKSTEFSFGTTAAIVTSMALIVGLDAATVSRATLLSGLLVVALADNLTDSISIHVYQESERLDRERAFRATFRNFIVRLLVAMTFVALVWLLPAATAVLVSSLWGLALLVALTAHLARERGVSISIEIAKHVSAALAVVVVSRLIGVAIQRVVH